MLDDYQPTHFNGQLILESLMNIPKCIGLESIAITYDEIKTIKTKLEKAMIQETKLRTLIKLWRDNADFLQQTRIHGPETDDMASVYNGCARTLEIYLEEIDDEEQDGS